jgi:CBS domain-containing protein
MATELHSLLERRLAGEQQTFARPLRLLVRRPPVTCEPAEPVSAAAARMRAEGVGSVVITDAGGRPIGIFTERDLIPAAIEGRLGQPLGDAMTQDPLGLPGHTPAYEAALAMTARGIRHVLVLDDAGRLAGVVSERALFSLQRLGLGELSMEIRMAKGVDTLARLADGIRKLARLLVEQGVAAEQLTLFVSVLNDRLCQRIVDLERNAHPLDRIGWSWFAFGSEGRLEQTFATDQDNGLAFESHAGEPPQAVRARLAPFARAVNEALDACGFPLCKGNIMASNPELCLSFDEWKAKLNGWLQNSDPQALLDAAICFDFRALAGDARIADRLREWMLGLTRTRQNFLRLMAENALQAKPPLGWIRDFTTEGENTLNLKLYGVRPFVDAARVYALGRGLPQTNTADRLRAAGKAGALPPGEAESLAAAFFFLQQVRLRHQAQLGDALAGQPEDAANRIDPSRLNELDRRTLREAFRLARDLQSRLAMDYHLK